MRSIAKHLTFANVVACLALFVALGGASYAAFKLPKNSVGTKQIKNNAVTAAKIKNGAITGSKIVLSSLGTVPSSATAANATKADSAAKAEAAATAALAANASSLQGLSAAQIKAAAKLTCPADMEMVAGFCAETEPRPETNWLAATQTCAEEGRVLPSIAQIAAYDIAFGVTEQEWADGLFENASGLHTMAVRINEGGFALATGPIAAPGLVAYRCVVAPSN